MGKAGGVISIWKLGGGEGQKQLHCWLLYQGQCTHHGHSSQGRINPRTGSIPGQAKYKTYQAGKKSLAEQLSERFTETLQKTNDVW